MRTHDLSHRYAHGLLHLGWNVRGTEINDRLAALYGVEERRPFNDHKMVKFAFALPEDQHSRNAGKHIVRQSMRGILPDEIRLRRDKADFSSVVAETLVRPEVFGLARFENLSRCGYVEPAEAREEFERLNQLFLSGSDKYIGRDWPLWMGLVAESWLGIVCGGAAPIDGSFPRQHPANYCFQ